MSDWQRDPRQSPESSPSPSTETERETVTPTDSPDVLVVGGGFAGCVAALSAARDRPAAAVELLVTSGDRFDRHTGTIDVLGYLPDAETADEADNEPGDDVDGPSTPVRRPLDALEGLPAAHPYRRLGRDRLRDALGTFDDELGYRGGATERNALVPTQAGRVRPVARYPAGMAAGLASRDEPMALVGFEQAPDLDAPFVADRLTERLPYEVTGATVAFPGRVTDYPSGPTLATALDEDEAPSGDVGLPAFDAGEELPAAEMPTEAMPPGLAGDDPEGPVRERLVERVLPELGVEGRVGFPAVLGQRAHAMVRETFESAFHADVFEVPVGPPSVPGRRLERRLHVALADAGVAVTHDDIEGFEATDGTIERVSLSEEERAVESVVLATGDLGGPGLVADRTGIREPVFGCHVEHPDDRSAWTDPTFLGDHAFARFGLSVDDELRPLDANGRPEYGNLRAVGRLVGGFDYDAEHSADGVALVTGYAAGRWALP